MLDLYYDNPKEAFDLLGFEYSEKDIYDSAIAELSNTAQKFADKVLARVNNPEYSNAGNNNSNQLKAA